MTDTTIAAYEPHRARLAELRDQFGGTVWVVETKDGMSNAKAARKELRAFRRQLEETKKVAKEKALAHCRAVDAEYHEVDDAAKELLEPCDSAIKEVEQRAKREAEEAARREEERQARCRSEIERIRNVPVVLVGASLEAIKKAGEELKTVDLTGLDEFAGVASNARVEAVEKLRAMYAEAKLREEEQARIAAERAELEKLRVEQAERDRVEREKREAEDRERRAKLEAEEREVRERIARQEQEAREAREKADAEARKAREAEEARLRAEREKLEVERRAREERERREREEREAVERVKRAKRVFLMDGREMLRVFVEKYEATAEFAPVVTAIRDYFAGLSENETTADEQAA